MEEIEATISGRVQLVMFRDFAQRKARALKLGGFVKNNNDGTVIAIAQGGKMALEAFIAGLRKGPFLSRVDSVEVRWRTPQSAYQDFSIRY